MQRYSVACGKFVKQNTFRSNLLCLYCNNVLILDIIHFNNIITQTTHNCNNFLNTYKHCYGYL